MTKKITNQELDLMVTEDINLVLNSGRTTIQKLRELSYALEGLRVWESEGRITLKQMQRHQATVGNVMSVLKKRAAYDRMESFRT